LFSIYKVTEWYYRDVEGDLYRNSAVHFHCLIYLVIISSFFRDGLNICMIVFIFALLKRIPALVSV